MVNGAMNADYECNGNLYSFSIIFFSLYFMPKRRYFTHAHTHTHTHRASETSSFYFANSKGHSSFPISEHEVLAQHMWRITVFHLHSPSGAFQMLFYTGLSQRVKTHMRLLMP